MNHKEYMINYHNNNKDRELKWRQEYCVKNREKLSDAKKLFRLNNKEKELKYKRKYYLKNKEKCQKYAREYYNRSENVLRKKEYMNTYRLKNKEELKKDNKEYYNQNKRKKISYQINYNRKYRHVKYKTNQQYNIGCRLRSLFHHALDKYASGKKMNSNKYGIDYIKIIKHLEPFPDNLSLYHIDHIRPLCSFNLHDSEEIKKAFAPENHQWLLAEENIRKGGKYNAENIINV